MTNPKLVAAIVVLALAGASPSALAQEAPQTGRYQLFQAEFQSEEDGANFPVLLDTQSGRSWMLVKRGGAFSWQTIAVGRLNNLPDDLLTRPTTALPPESLKK